MFVVDFPGTRRDVHEFKLNGMMDHTAMVFGNFTGSELSEGGRNYEGIYSMTVRGRIVDYRACAPARPAAPTRLPDARALPLLRSGSRARTTARTRATTW